MATILVVDDNEMNRSVLTTLLGYRGHRMVEASNGLEAIDQAIAGCRARRHCGHCHRP